jgi:hypothetical protein
MVCVDPLWLTKKKVQLVLKIGVHNNLFDGFGQDRTHIFKG